MATKGAYPKGSVTFRGLKRMSGLPRIAGSVIKGALYGGAYAGHKQGEENEASSEPDQGEENEVSSEPAQSNAQGPPGCAKAQNGKAGGAGRSGKGKVGSKGSVKAAKASKSEKR
jgi:hypothetical protein